MFLQTCKMSREIIAECTLTAETIRSDIVLSVTSPPLSLILCVSFLSTCCLGKSESCNKPHSVQK